MNATHATALQRFLVRWLASTTPGLRCIRVRNGGVEVLDALGWRAVGMLEDYVSLARSMGAIPMGSGR